MPQVGDIKTTIKTEDHKGWFVMDGRDITDPSLNSRARDSAVLLGYGTKNAGVYTGAIADAREAYLGTNGEELGKISGSNEVNITYSMLPKVDLPLAWTNPSATGNEHLWVKTAGGYRVLTQGGTTWWTGPYTATGARLNTTGSQQPVANRPKTLIVTLMIYLGL